MFSKWTGQTYITFDSEKLAAYEKSEKDKGKSKIKKLIFEIKTKNLKVSKSFQKFEKKIVFGVMDSIHKKKHILGFNNEVTCQRIHQLLFGNMKTADKF